MKSLRIVTVSVSLIWWSLDTPDWWLIHYSQQSINLLEWPISDISCEDCTAQLRILSYLGNARMLPILYIYFVFSWKLYSVIRIFVSSSQWLQHYSISHCDKTEANLPVLFDSQLVAIVFNKLRINCKTKIN